MKRLFTPFILLLCAGAIALGAFLPRIFSGWQDSRASGKVSYAPVSDISLDMSGQQKLSLRTKLALQADYADVLTIPGSMTDMSTGDLEAVVQDTVRIYQESGLFPTGLKKVTAQDFQAQAYLLRASHITADSNIVWNVQVFQMDTQLRYYLDLVIDDETGTVLSLNFRDSRKMGTQDDFPEGEQKLRAFCLPFLRALGEEFAEYDDARLLEENYNRVTEQFFTLQIQWSDLIYGATHMHFAVSPGEYYVTIY